MLRLGDHHSYYVTAAGGSIRNPDPRGCFDPAVPSPIPQAGVGYVRIGSFSGPDEVGFATMIENQIRAADALDLVGWIVDLRGGATLLLTVSTMPDRNLTLYGTFVIPDELTASPDETVQRALAWLHGS